MSLCYPPPVSPNLATHRPWGTAVPAYDDRLELTWTNKHLLDDAGAVGEVSSDRDRARDNLLIRGDSLKARGRA
jgi:hypothetical protein